MALVTFTIVNWLVSIPQCTLFDAILHPVKYSYTACINRFVVLMVPFVLNIITDLIILALPVSTVGCASGEPKTQGDGSRYDLLLVLFGDYSIMSFHCPERTRHRPRYLHFTW
ncbi:hypothetical protein BDV23DRAFT_164157 [Aspergillus alliaceus]|uniref:Integral membrane protein n=1 Tax=Petromyces alliaceus TaxID=209559 RepID=A0A5N7BWC1_PETAA|nr:hypothetical protein BDV23DRAFT_164157 [Aspergillus alliaceus]